MSDELALLAAIRANPLDDAPRLVYADWLDEQGGESAAARAEFIRVQCEMELLPANDPRYRELEQRENALLDSRGKEWLASLPQRYRKAEFWRGFPVPTLRNLSVDQLVKLTDRALRSAPLWRFPYTPGSSLDTLLSWPQLHQLTMIGLYGPSMPDGWARQVAECDGLRNITELAFTNCPLSVPDLKRILDAWKDRRLTALWVNSCPVGDAGIRLIAKHPATAGLRLLRAHSAKITSRGVKAVADGPNLDRVTLATFAHNPIGDTGGRHLLRWKALPSLKEFYLMNAGMSGAIKDKFRERLGKRVIL